MSLTLRRICLSGLLPLMAPASVTSETLRENASAFVWTAKLEKACGDFFNRRPTKE
jgi:hypothetical protein